MLMVVSYKRGYGEKLFYFSIKVYIYIYNFFKFFNIYIYIYIYIYIIFLNFLNFYIIFVKICISLPG